MASKSEYFVNKLLLRISGKGLVVQVCEMSDDPPHQDQLSDLPDWIFRSTQAIWLAESDSTLYGRAQAGERIKKELMTALSKTNSKSKRWAS